MEVQKLKPQQQKPKQLLLWKSTIQNKRFTLEKMLIAKLNILSKNIDQLSHAEVVWLSRIEDFFSQHEYITQRQSEVVDLIMQRNSRIQSTPINEMECYN